MIGNAILVFLLNILLCFLFKTHASLYINNALRKIHSSTYIKKHSSSKFIRHMFYFEFREEIPIFWFLHNAFLNCYFPLALLIGLVCSFVSHDSFIIYIRFLHSPAILYCFIVYIISGIKRHFN